MKKNGEENVNVMAVANCKLTTDIKINTFIAKKQIPLIKLKTINFWSTSLKTVKYSFVKKSNKNKGITAEIFLNTVN